MPDYYELEDIRAFRQIARAGSLSRAAVTYNIPKATLSHHLRRLEDALKVRNCSPGRPKAWSSQMQASNIWTTAPPSLKAVKTRRAQRSGLIPLSVAV